MISLFIFAFVVAVIVIGGAMVLRLYRELANLHSEMQALRDQLAERDQDLEPCIGFVFEQPDEYELDYELDVCRNRRR